MHQLSSANGIEYYHFLQPNQYVPETKPMGRAERKQAFDPSERWRPGVVKGYPKLIAAGRQLRGWGLGLVSGSHPAIVADEETHHERPV